MTGFSNLIFIYMIQVILLSLKCNLKPFINRKNMSINDYEDYQCMFKSTLRIDKEIKYHILYDTSRYHNVVLFFFLLLEIVLFTVQPLILCTFNLFLQLLLHLQLLNVFHQMYRPNTTVSVDFKYVFQNDFISYLI